MNDSLINLLRRALEMRRSRRRCAACLVIKARGSTPQAAGSLMLVDEDLNSFGTIGGGCVEAEVRRRAHGLLCQGESFAGSVVRFKLDHDYGWDDGLICGGTIELAISPVPEASALQRAIDHIRNRRATCIEFSTVNEAGILQAFHLNIPPADRLYIAGAGHVGQALARLAIGLQFDPTMFDDRQDLLDRCAPDGCVRVSGDIASELRAAPIDDRTYVVIVTRGHKHDEQALHAVIGRGARYVGMIGSRRKIKLIFDDLRDMGVEPLLLRDVHAPIGLDIGSITVEEIALSIAAELVQVRRQGDRTEMVTVIATEGSVHIEPIQS